MASNISNDSDIQLIGEDIECILWWNALDQEGQTEVRRLYFPEGIINNENIKKGYSKTVELAELVEK